jgi:hypothetical protein
VVVVVLVAFDLRDNGPVIKVVGSFVEGVVGRCGALMKVVKPWGHGLGNFFIEIVGGEE